MNIKNIKADLTARRGEGEIMRNLYGMINATEVAFEEKCIKFEMINERLQMLGIYQTAIEFKRTSIARWKWVMTLPTDYIENPLFIQNIEDELRQEAIQQYEKQKEMGMDNAHLQILWDELFN